MARISRMQRRIANARRAKRMVYGDQVPSKAERDWLKVTGMMKHRAWRERIKSLGLTLGTYYKVKRKACGRIKAAAATVAMAWLMVKP